MQQVNLLTVDISQSPDVSGSSADFTDSSSKGKNPFSELVEQHMSDDVRGNKWQKEANHNGNVKEKSAVTEVKEPQVSKSDKASTNEGNVISADENAAQQNEQVTTEESPEKLSKDALANDASSTEKVAVVQEGTDGEVDINSEQSQQFIEMLAQANEFLKPEKTAEGTIKGTSEKTLKAESSEAKTNGGENAKTLAALKAIILSEEQQAESSNDDSSAEDGHLINVKKDLSETPLQTNKAERAQVKTTEKSQATIILEDETTSDNSELGKKENPFENKLAFNNKEVSVSSDNRQTLDDKTDFSTANKNSKSTVLEDEIISKATKLSGSENTVEQMEVESTAITANEEITKYSKNNTVQDQTKSTNTNQGGQVSSPTLPQQEISKEQLVAETRNSAHQAATINMTSTINDAKNALDSLAKQQEHGAKQAHVEGPISPAESESNSANEQQSAEQDSSLFKQQAEQLLTKNSGEKVAEQNDKTISSTLGVNTSAQSLTSNYEQSLSSSYQEQVLDAMGSKVAAEQGVGQKSQFNLQPEAIAIYRKDFANAMKDKVMVMINQKLQQIEIRLDPAELGSVQVRVNLQNEQAVVSFMVQNQQAKEALEQNIGKLREMLAESGVDVGDANVNQQDQETDNEEQLNQQNGSFSRGGADHHEEQSVIMDPKLFKASANGVDYYA